MQNTVIYKQQSKIYIDRKVSNLKLVKVSKTLFEVALRSILIIALIIAGITVLTSNTDLLFRIKSFTVLSGSMEPTIPVGSIIYTKKSLGYNLGDIITFKNAAGLTVTHRIVSVQNTGEVIYLTKGDANSAKDAGYVTAEKIIGKTYFFLPVIGKVSGLLKTPKGLFLAVFIPAIIVIGYELFVIKKELEKSIEKRILERIHQQGEAHTHSLWPDTIS